jgi:hypothetical protein
MTETTPALTAGQQLAKQLSAWSDDDLVTTAHLTTDQVITSDSWECGPDGMLTFQGDGGVLHFVNPDLIAIIHFDGPSSADAQLFQRMLVTSRRDPRRS